MTETPSRVDEATERIDAFIKDCSGRSLVDSSTAIDVLLDIRVLIASPDRTPDTPASDG